MCGFPANHLETYVNMLLDRGFDVVVSSLENGERSTRNIVSTNKEDPVQSKPVGRIDYLHTDGTVRESVEYTSPYQLEKDIKEKITTVFLLLSFSIRIKGWEHHTAKFYQRA